MTKVIGLPIVLDGDAMIVLDQFETALETTTAGQQSHTASHSGLARLAPGEACVS